jgi:hypothetical protein
LSNLPHSFLHHRFHVSSLQFESAVATSAIYDFVLAFPVRFPAHTDSVAARFDAYNADRAGFTLDERLSDETGDVSVVSYVRIQGRIQS